MTGAVDGARSFVHVEFYITAWDEVTTPFCEALVRATERGVPVRLLFDHLGSRGIVPVTVLQSYEQGVTVWGEHGMATLWGAATKKIIGAGVDSPRLARDLATLIGQHEVPVRTLNG